MSAFERLLDELTTMFVDNDGRLSTDQIEAMGFRWVGMNIPIDLSRCYVVVAGVNLTQLCDGTIMLVGRYINRPDRYCYKYDGEA